MPSVDTMFLFIAEGTAVERVDRKGPGGPLAYVWVPDADEAARVAAEQAAAGLGLLELYRGFGLAEAGKVIEAVAGRAPVGFAGDLGGVRHPRSITLYGDPGADPLTETVTVEHPHGARTTVAPAPDDDAMVAAALEAVESGADVVEICGGTSAATASRVHAAVGDRATVTLVRWPFESITPAAAYAAAFES
ncbi:DUF6506 family protein [Streptomyces sp. NPDC048172]|uniref:DUF6506 family protein n=1 Tax=Streptomyces sp. NPDC048172 TaxID=3365505 RepID=UPI00371F889E